MDARAEQQPWECQPREDEEAYAAFLAYRDLGPWRSHEATRMHLGKRPGLPRGDRAVVGLLGLARSGRPPGTTTCNPSATSSTARRRPKWERRRLQALEEGWELCRKLRARLGRMMAMPPEMPTPPVAPPEPAPPMPEPIPEAVATPEEARESAGRGPSRGNCLTVMRLAKLVVELEWALIAEALPPPGKIDPLTATPEELQAYLVLNPRFKHLPPRR